MLSLGASRAEALSGIIRHALISALSPLMTQVGGTSCLFPAASFLLPLSCCLAAPDLHFALALQMSLLGLVGLPEVMAGQMMQGAGPVQVDCHMLMQLYTPDMLYCMWYCVPRSLLC